MEYRDKWAGLYHFGISLIHIPCHTWHTTGPVSGLSFKNPQDVRPLELMVGIFAIVQRFTHKSVSFLTSIKCLRATWSFTFKRANAISHEPVDWYERHYWPRSWGLQTSNFADEWKNDAWQFHTIWWMFWPFLSFNHWLQKLIWVEIVAQPTTNKNVQTSSVFLTRTTCKICRLAISTRLCKNVETAPEQQMGGTIKQLPFASISLGNNCAELGPFFLPTVYVRQSASRFAFQSMRNIVYPRPLGQLNELNPWLPKVPLGSKSRNMSKHQSRAPGYPRQPKQLCFPPIRSRNAAAFALELEGPLLGVWWVSLEQETGMKSWCQHPKTCLTLTWEWCTNRGSMAIKMASSTA